MLTVDEALAKIAQRLAPRPAQALPTADALGLVLAEEIASDIDSPPHDKALVDGYAVVAADLASGRAQLRVLEEVTAGRVPTRPVQAGEATRIMTGAPLPDGADAVVMVERTQLDGDKVTIEDASIRPGSNFLPRARSMRAGEVVLSAGAVLRPIELGLLAEVGRVTVRAVPAPRVAVLSTGDELLPAERTPGPGQIRNSNGPLLRAAVARCGGVAIDLGIALDEREDLSRAIARGLAEADVLILSGGVSAGVLDLVPGVLAELGVVEVFHKVRMKPGKPVWFGVQRDPRGDRFVFGLPGNPVSTLVCYELFVRPALARLAGRAFAGAPATTLPLTGEFTHRGDRPTYHPGRLVNQGESSGVEPLRWHGSADLRSLASADALIHFAAGDRSYRPGEAVAVQPL